VHNYNQRFIREVISIQEADDKIKTYLLRKGLEKGTKFAESIMLKVPQDFTHFLRKVEKYIQNEAMLEANRVMNASLEKENEPKTERGKNTIEHASLYHKYTYLNIFQDCILNECSNPEFKEEGI